QNDPSPAPEPPPATDVVEGLADGLDTELPERGRTLSGGQRQRLMLAQAIRADPEGLVLDEPTNAVDAHTEAAIAGRLRRIRTGRTTVVFSTSPLLLEHADQVALLEGEGTVTATGTHAELISSNAAYRELVTRGMVEGARIRRRVPARPCRWRRRQPSAAKPNASCSPNAVL